MAARLRSDFSIQSFVQQGRRFKLSDIAAELHGELEVSEEAEISGGYADIYRRTWTTPQGERIEVAIKEVKKLTRKNKHDDENALAERVRMRVKREAFIWSRTKHPNLHPFLGYRLQPRPRLISPWYRHGNLLDYLGANPRLPRLDKMILIRQAACGLEHLHSQNPPICHGDIKPENVLINDQLEAVISDFGLGRVLLGLGIHTGFTTSETAHGTLRYMAAELFAEENPRSSLQTDVYAFGGLTLAVLSGKSPFFELKPIEVIAGVMQGRQPRAEDHPELPSLDPLWSLIRRCWDKNPDARPSMKKFLQEHREYIDKELPRQPEISTSYSHIYPGTWTSLNSEQVEVAIKELRVPVPDGQETYVEALSLKLDAVSISSTNVRHFNR
ncbi:hypothetical protein FS837_000429 [Tulasnella sp. UAMH 9824]|nr:hypothetical protein FS837_000429 [Tulasnella sp. UAMH 9824]